MKLTPKTTITLKVVGFCMAAMTVLSNVSGSTNTNWERFKQYYLPLEDVGLSLDISRMKFSETFFSSMERRMQNAFSEMEALEKGSIANPTENRMVGHYWLRNTQFAPSDSIQKKIEGALEQIKEFVKKVHKGDIEGSDGKFKNLLIIGIGGSALGPQFVSEALGSKKDKMKLYFFDNTDPDGIDRVLESLQGKLGKTLTIVISKSGGTAETRNGMLEAQKAYEKAGLNFSKHAVAITGEKSKLDQYALKAVWLERFPLWDWVGGRTSELSPVGLLPAALQGIKIDGMLEGAKKMDAITRTPKTLENPAAMLALMWYYATNGKGEKDMVILPYKDRLQLFSKYLQQLVMESLGKQKDLTGKRVEQGIAVYGNKGSTDQHAYVQQLREGVNNFFVTFIEVVKDRKGASISVESDHTSGEFLQAFMLGTRDALYENDRESLTITLEEVSPRTIGALIALYERAVGYYAFLVGINAYDQPGVEAGKKAAANNLKLKSDIVNYLKENEDKWFTSEEIAQNINAVDKKDLVFKILDHLALNENKPIKKKSKRPFYKTQFSYDD